MEGGALHVFPSYFVWTVQKGWGYTKMVPESIPSTDISSYFLPSVSFNVCVCVCVCTDRRRKNKQLEKTFFDITWRKKGWR